MVFLFSRGGVMSRQIELKKIDPVDYAIVTTIVSVILTAILGIITVAVSTFTGGIVLGGAIIGVIIMLIASAGVGFVGGIVVAYIINFALSKRGIKIDYEWGK